VLLVGSFLAWALAARGGVRHSLATARAYLDLLTWLPELPAARRAVQKLRAVSDSEFLALHDARLPVAQVDSGALVAPAERLLTSIFGCGRRLAVLLGVR
jgi:hypothetical protein